MTCTLRQYESADLPSVLEIWNEVIEEGGSIPWISPLSSEDLSSLLGKQLWNCTAVNEKGEVCGFYTLSPNLFGRCGTIANATYLVKKECRGAGIGEMLVWDSLEKARALGFRIMQFNGVVDSNKRARALYRKVGFTEAGVIPKGFQVKDGHYEDMHILYYVL